MFLLRLAFIRNRHSFSIRALLRCAYAPEFDDLRVCRCVVLNSEMAKPEARYCGTENYLEGATLSHAELLWAVVGLLVVSCDDRFRDRQGSAPWIAQPDYPWLTAGTHFLLPEAALVRGHSNVRQAGINRDRVAGKIGDGKP